MKNFRTYGNPPYRVAVIHGGPGAPGEMAPVARELSRARGILEPLQTEPTVEGQFQELSAVLAERGHHPVTAIGHSWGAMLSFILAARNPSLIAKLILVSSGPFEDKYATGIMGTRSSRLTEEDKTTMDAFWGALRNPNTNEKNQIFARLGELVSKADSYDPLPHQSEVIEYQHDVYASVWGEAKELRSSGDLVALGTRIQCPVVVMHGDRDPHPWQGVEEPLSRVLKDFRFILLEDCGHYPWIERAARDRFYDTLREELA